MHAKRVFAGHSVSGQCFPVITSDLGIPELYARGAWFYIKRATILWFCFLRIFFFISFGTKKKKQRNTGVKIVNVFKGVRIELACSTHIDGDLSEPCHKHLWKVIKIRSGFLFFFISDNEPLCRLVEK